MFKLAMKFDIDPRDPQWRRTWRVTDCWKVNEHATRFVKVEHKNKSRPKRLLILSPYRVQPGTRITPRHILLRMNFHKYVTGERASWLR